MAETHEQQAVVSWFRLAYRNSNIIAIPNGQWIAGRGKQKYALINKYKAEGLMPGVSDLLICEMRGGFGGLWLEMKDNGKTRASVSQEQRDWIGKMIRSGYRASWASGFDEAKEIVEIYMGMATVSMWGVKDG